MIITCPHCQTRYQVALEAIGARGRKVQCAHCQKAWSQKPGDADADGVDDADPAVRNIAEDALDDALVSEERRVAAEQAARDKTESAENNDAAGADPILIRNRQRAFSRRRRAMESRLPLARLRRAARIVGAIALSVLLVGGYFGRVEVVERFPALAGAYAAIGLPVNVIGLTFDGLTTLRTQRDGQGVLVVSADIVGVQKNPIVVPPVVVTLIDDAGNDLYRWRVTPEARDLMAGERTHFETQLLQPPKSAVRVRLSFTGGETAPQTSAFQPVSAEKP